MNTTVLPYTRQALESLRQTLALHRQMVWLNPNTGQIDLKDEPGTRFCLLPHNHAAMLVTS